MLHPRDVPGAVEGGADRLHLLAAQETGGHAPPPDMVAEVCRISEVPVRVTLRLNDGLSTTGGELVRLVGLGEEYVGLGAEGVVFGFLNTDLDVDVEVCASLAGQLSGVPWTFSPAFDSALNTDRAWRQVAGLPGLDAVMSAGSPRGLAAGADELTDRAGRDPDVARLAMPAGGLQAEHVPWLLRAGVRQFHVGSSVRPGGSWTKSYVDAAHVRSWRLLLDDAADRAVAAGAGWSG